MDPPAAKKRRLAPKEPPQPQPAFPPHESVQEAVPTAPPPPERHEFESFARHLQDAAMLIYRQSQISPYSNASVLILRWEEENDDKEDAAADQDLVAFEQVLRERYNYPTERWDIPTVPNASVKLGVKLQSFLERQAPNHLLIVYYTGYAYAGVDSQLVWASNSTEHAAKLKWSGLRCLFDESPSDMLLLLDSCAMRDVPAPGNGASLKQIIAATGPEKSAQEFQGQSFTSSLADAFLRLSTGRPFTAEHLWHEVAYQRQQELLQNSGLTNGASKGVSLAEKLPIIHTLSRGKTQNLSLAPLVSRSDSPVHADGDAHLAGASQQEHAIHPNTVAGLTFDEPRVLVCTTFVGEASPDMSSFNQWLHNSPGVPNKIVVEGMFLGPPTMLLISMPVAVWNVVQHDKVCCFLGYITSKNLTHLYKHLVGSASPVKVSPEDGRILLEAREAASTTPIIHRQEYHHTDQSYVPRLPETPIRLDLASRGDPMSLSQPSISGVNRFPNSTPTINVAKLDDGEDTAEMQEAAEQLKALSHVRHRSISDAARAHASLMELTPEVKHDEGASHEAEGSGLDEQQNTPSAKPKPRRSLAKVTPKQETRCDLCSHAPFKDSSSLRKHIAAAHTRPFPCAFAFAGCTSTFGSKNEWKRHIASQHLCLTYYRCSSCPQSTVEGKGNEFNRKDLFTQHLRRMHAPFAIKKSITKGDSKLQVEWETHVKEMQTSCLIIRRQPPQRSACPKSDCASVFEGPTSWDEWTEHVGRHMEKGEAARLGVDRLLAKWALDAGVIERKDDGEYRLCNGPGPGGEKESSSKHNGATNHSDTNSRESEEKMEEKITVATSTTPEKMEVDE
ncbi:hypothetical protein BKA67DRAFT_516277 [Truncatella angustata]|uniref:C2H2-type domain-containing protein n=1 Tax=Truncatella angustata TaxID=152316 RepID=A0A9P8UNV2_9PEZI|nr:uncharacterized protein BKA67DRAFT_516277 [Truncatella angustata]KAH6655406.1 hypothetical protein BKA67DRAFT_516277 [Truncatella angustata]